MSPFDEQHLRFAFDDRPWSVVKQDERPDHRERTKRLERATAVAFLGLHRDGNEIFDWIEVRDFRGYRVWNKKRISEGKLAVERTVWPGFVSCRLWNSSSSGTRPVLVATCPLRGRGDEECCLGERPRLLQSLCKP